MEYVLHVVKKRNSRPFSIYSRGHVHFFFWRPSLGKSQKKFLKNGPAIKLRALVAVLSSLTYH